MAELILFRCRTPMHVGAEGKLDVVDMPVQREVHTNFPKVEASSIKGVLRNDFSINGKGDGIYTEDLFGPENDGSEHSGCLRVFDARLLLFPVKSARGIFAWITCPYVIKRFINDLKASEIKFQTNLSENDCIDVKEDEAYCSNITDLKIPNKKDSDKKDSGNYYIVLDEFAYKCNTDQAFHSNLISLISEIIPDGENTSADSLKDKLKKDIVILNDNVFKYFVEMGTEVNTRIKIGNDGVVENGHLFSEEHIPAETFLYSFLSFEKVKKANDNFENKRKTNSNSSDSTDSLDKVYKRYIKELKIVQIGGNKTLGKGITEIYLFSGGGNE